MNRRTEDKITMLAFGELSEQEAAEVRAMASHDPEAARLLASYEAMREGLRDLRDIPESQLSRERLQDAILGQGLKPERRGSWVGWLWAPTGAMVTVLALAMLMRTSPVEPVAGPDEGKINLVLAESTMALDPTATQRPLSVQAGGGEVEAAVEGAQNLVASSINVIEPSPEAPSVELNASAEPASTKRPSLTRPRRAPARSLLASEPARIPVTEGPIVLIRSDLDSTTGAHRAIETESIANVVVAS